VRRAGALLAGRGEAREEGCKIVAAAARAGLAEKVREKRLVGLICECAREGTVRAKRLAVAAIAALAGAGMGEEVADYGGFEAVFEVVSGIGQWEAAHALAAMREAYEVSAKCRESVSCAGALDAFALVECHDRRLCKGG
jgi:hypothetical protein